MTNLLKKSTNYFYAGTPGSPGSPGQAAYTSYETQTVCSWVLKKGTSISGSITVTSEQYSYQCTQQQVAVYHPAIAATAPTVGTTEQTSYYYNLGWNSGARSNAFFTTDGYVQFTVLAGVSGVIAGLNDIDADAGYSNINHAFYLTHGIARILENGVEKAYLGAYASGATFRIDRKFGVVTYYIDNVLKYTSATPSAGTVFLDASLYAGGDTIDTPAVGSYSLGAAAVSFQPMQSVGGGSYAQSSVAFLPMVVVSNPQSSSSVSFQPLQVMSADRPYGTSVVSFKPMTVSSNPGELAPSYSLSSVAFSPMTTTGLMLTGGIGGAAVRFQPMQTMATNKVYGESSVSFLPMVTDGSAFEGNLNASIRELMFSTSQISFFGSIDVLLMSSVGATSTLATLVLKNAAVATAVNVSGTMTYSAIMQALMQTYIQSFAGIPILTQDGEVWVVNDDSKASTSYEGYGFNSFAKFNNKYYGAKADGVFLLEGDTDAGLLVRSAISLGKQDFGTSSLKTVPNCYIGVSSAGDVYLKVIANGTSYLYKTMRSDTYLKTQRIQLGKGLKANYLTFELYNETGADFELASIEFEVAQLSRRI